MVAHISLSGVLVQLAHKDAGPCLRICRPCTKGQQVGRTGSQREDHIETRLMPAHKGKAWAWQALLSKQPSRTLQIHKAAELSMHRALGEQRHSQAVPQPQPLVAGLGSASGTLCLAAMQARLCTVGGFSPETLPAALPPA